MSGRDNTCWKGKMDNLIVKLNNSRRGVNVIKKINRRLPWLKVVLAVILTVLLIVTILAWQIWLNSPQRGALKGPVAEKGKMIMDSGRKETVSEDDLVEVVTVVPAEEGQETHEMVERTEVRVLQRMKRVIPAGKPLIALTFDDGPSGITTPKLLDELKARKVRATFFMLGRMARGNPEVVKRAYREGHEIGSHTMHHQNLVRISEAAARADVEEANQVFISLTGEKPALTRAPYGNVNAMVARVVGTPLINWTIDTNDWRKENRAEPQRIVDAAIHNAFDGAIVLMHDIYPTTAEKVGEIIDGLRARGYELVTVSEMAEARGVTMGAGAEYRKFEP